MSGERLPGLATQVFARRVIRLPQTDSTNRYLKEHASSLPHGALCYTGNQTAGRGRLGRSWIVPADRSLALSLLLRPAQPPVLPAVCGWAVARALRRHTGGDFRIKWPNDIICGGRKVCGILCEGILSRDGGCTVAGIGINLLQGENDFAQAGLPYATSVRIETGVTLTLDETAAAVMNELEPLWLLCRSQGFGTLRGDYESCCVTVGQTVRVLSPDGAVRCCGVAKGIAEDGGLLVESDGVLERIVAGEASVRGLYGYV